MWFIFALLSAVFAALTSILAKVGINGVNSNLATAIRTVVVVIMAWGIVFLTNAQNGLSGISRKSWLFLILSGLATGASWLCFGRNHWFGLFPLRSPLLRESSFLSLPPGNKMFQFPGLSSSAYFVQRMMHGLYSMRVSPFGYLRIKACLRLPEDFRS